MKKNLLTALLPVCLLLMVCSGCLKDDCTRTYKLYYPVYKSLTDVRKNMKSGPAQSLHQTGRLYLFGKYIFLNEPDKGIHVIDNSNPSSPKNISFITIPGNAELAVRGNYLYADSYSDLAVFDISNPVNINAKNFISNVFPERNRFYYGNSSNPDSVKVVVDYIEKDTMVSCETMNYWQTSCVTCSASSGGVFYLSNSSIPSTQAGIGGSMARFTILDNYLYTVSSSDLYSFNLSDGMAPQQSAKTNLGNWNIETIYPFKDKLFIGSTNGMFIFGVTDPAHPAQLAQFSHVRSCDPVIADGNYAYVTLRSGTTCQGYSNQMDILSIANLSSPSLVKTYAMTNPHGLSKDGNTLFICDGKDGLKVFDATDVYSVKLVKQLSGMEAIDVIAANNTVMVIAADGLYQYDYADTSNIKLLSKISFGK